MTTLYVYEIETRRVIATVTGGTQLAQEGFAEITYGFDHLATTYSPAFGMVDGLIDNANAERIELYHDGRFARNGSEVIYGKD